MKNYKQKALDHVRSVCPELMELSFGCVVNVGGRQYVLDSDITIEKCEGEIRKADNYHVLKNNYNDLRVDLTNTPWGIVGHTPHLEHWLRGLESTGGSYCVEGDGDISKYEHNSDRYEHLDVQYNLTKDGENQSEEFYKAYCEIVDV